jgi:hypothetical protein
MSFLNSELLYPDDAVGLLKLSVIESVIPSGKVSREIFDWISLKIRLI